MILRPLARRAARAHHATTVAAAVILAAVAPRVYAQAVRIGVVDIQRAITETNEGRQAAQAIKARYDARQDELNRRTKAIEGLKARIEHPRAPIPQAKLQKMAVQYQQSVQELEQIGQQYSGELQQLEGELVKQSMSKMQPILREIGQSDNYQIIIDQRVALFSPTHLNLTDRVIQMYNQRNPVRPDAGLLPALPPPANGAGATGRTVAPEPDEEPTPAPAPALTDGGTRGALPSVFYRRDH